MEKVGCGQTVQILRNGKKKQAKYELDRQKQAEKKKRRLEKALATSAAIRLELEKKKQKQLEEQQVLDKEGAVTAEAEHALTPRKGNKKQTNNEVDRQKQAEKKKRRLEKALATSAAIRSELEKKKQKKLEEQQRLDKEGAAIAEAVALHVLGEDDDESCQIMLNLNERCTPWDHPNNHGFFMGRPSFGRYTSVGGPGWVADAYGSERKWYGQGFACSFPWGLHAGSLQTPYHANPGQGAEISPGLIAAQAVSSLRIADTHTRIHSLAREQRPWC